MLSRNNKTTLWDSLHLINEVYLQQQIKATTVEEWREVMAHPEEQWQRSAGS